MQFGSRLFFAVIRIAWGRGGGLVGAAALGLGAGGQAFRLWWYYIRLGNRVSEGNKPCVFVPKVRLSPLVDPSGMGWQKKHDVPISVCSSWEAKEEEQIKGGTSLSCNNE